MHTYQEQIGKRTTVLTAVKVKKTRRTTCIAGILSKCRHMYMINDRKNIQQDDILKSNNKLSSARKRAWAYIYEED